MPDRSASIQNLIDQYIQEHQHDALREKSFFEGMPSIELAIHHAAFAIDDQIPAKRYSHQRRIRIAPMRKAYYLLSMTQAQLLKMKSFDELHALLKSHFGGIKGLGALYTYDAALRIGFYLKLEPTSVYLQAGTRLGARNLGIKVAGPLSLDILPKPLRLLRPYEIANFLCIYSSRHHVKNEH